MLLFCRVGGGAQHALASRIDGQGCCRAALVQTEQHPAKYPPARHRRPMIGPLLLQWRPPSMLSSPARDQSSPKLQPKKIHTTGAATQASQRRSPAARHATTASMIRVQDGRSRARRRRETRGGRIVTRRACSVPLAPGRGCITAALSHGPPTGGARPHSHPPHLPAS